MCALTHIAITTAVQKHTQLKAKPGLITDGLFSLSRNINYFGELLIYGAFMALTGRSCAAQRLAPAVAGGLRGPAVGAHDVSQGQEPGPLRGLQGILRQDQDVHTVCGVIVV